MSDTSPPGLRSAAVRRRNLATLLRVLHDGGSASRSELGATSGLTRSAIGGLVSDLTELGFVVEEATQSDGRPGRPSTTVVPVGPGNIAISAVVLVDRLTVTAIGLGGVVLGSRRQRRPRERASADRTVDALAVMIGEVLADLDDGWRIFGVGVAVPGLVRPEDGVVSVAPNLGWTDVPLADLLSARLSADVPVLVRNEANLGALAEYRRGAAAGHQHVLYVSGEVGVGGGIITNGEVALGGAGFAGEFGHLHVRDDGQRCECGASGCWETEVGEGALLARLGLDPQGGQPAVDAVVARADDGDAEARAALAEHGRWVGIGLASLANVLNPDIVVLGGVFAQAFEHIEASVLDEIRARALTAVAEACAIVPSSLASSALSIGAAEVVWDAVLDDPVSALESSVGAWSAA